ncbi:hypothetical protein BP5796_04021 [Coleophoma crateriformis]|uniref:Uncharacterized protein n=1 Tax=Coleophoma crateriformis TaxID=565419 RepID=A0A3D8SHA9_9HELO|nr:hypothetical protein BP5796_04021 [Coleophoma crateriformis]
MPPRQRTFEIVPTTLAVTTGPVRPMTSKEAKKAYAKASRVPKLSRAEQRRLEAEERERQRKEYERERAAAKAKAAREKKAEKAAAERDARKKAGLPEPSKFVRPSQPTISVFVTTGTKRTWQEADGNEQGQGDASEVVNEEPEDEVQPAAKRIVLEDSEDDFGDFPSLSQSDIPQILDNPDSSNEIALINNDGVSKAGSPTPSPGREAENVPAPSQELPPLWKDGGDDYQDLNSQALADMINTQLRSEAAEAESRAVSDAGGRISSSPLITVPPPIEPRKCIEPPRCIPRPVPSSMNLRRDMQATSSTSQNLPDTPTKLTSSHKLAPRVIHGHRISLDHTFEHDKEVNKNLTVKQIHTTEHNHTVNTGHTVFQKHTVAQGHTVHQAHTFETTPLRALERPNSRPPLRETSFNMMPPPRVHGTIAKISNTPARVRPASRTDHNTLKNTFIDTPPSATQAFLDTHFDDFFPSPSQQVRELEDEINDLPSNTQVARELEDDHEISSSTDDGDKDAPIVSQTLPQNNTKLMEASTEISTIPGNEVDEDVGFYCTQDLVLSSQDMAEIDTPSRAPPVEILMPAPPRRTRFFEEKEEDLVLAAMHESRILAEQKKQGQKVPLNESFGTDYGDFDIDDDILNEAILQNNSGAERKKSGKRTLVRVPSGMTDYGEDDFSGCSQEILAALDCAEHSANSSLQ